MNKTSFDLIIVGGGVLGTFHAFHALKRGLKVALIEKNEKPRGATIQNFGQVVPSGMDGKWQKFGRRSLHFYKEIQQEFDISVRENGSIYIASNDEEMQLIEELAAINKENHYTSELLSSAQCLAKYPALRDDYCKGGLFFSEEISINPRRMIHRLQQYISQKTGIQLFFSTLVRELFVQSDGEVIAKTHDGKIFSAPKALVCSGSEFKLLFPEIFNQSDLEAVKLQMLRLKPQKAIDIPGNILTGLSIRRYESFVECPSYAAIKAKEEENSFWKKWGIHILFKQEVDGSIILGDSHEYADAKDFDKLGFDLREEINTYFIDEGKKIFNLEHWQPEIAWTGLYSQSKSKDIFEHTIDKHIHIITGIGGKGMTASAGFSEFNLKSIYND